MSMDYQWMESPWRQNHNIMIQNKGRMLVHPNHRRMSDIFTKAKQFYYHRTSKLWFTNLFSISDIIQYSKIQWDITKIEFIELLKIFNYAVVDMSPYYRNTYENLSKLLNMMNSIFGLRQLTPVHTGYQIIMSQIHYNSALALLMIKLKHYAKATQCFDQILEVARLDLVDVACDVFLVTVSNYLSFLRNYPLNQVKHKVLELVALLTHIYRILLDKYTATGCQEGALLIMLGIYKQYEPHLSKYNAETKLLLKKYEEYHHPKDKDRDNRFQINNEVNKVDQFLQKNKACRVEELEINKQQLYLTSPTNKLNQKKIYNPSILTQRPSLQLERINGGESSILQSQTLSYEENQGSLPKAGNTIELDRINLKDGGKEKFRYRRIRDNVLENNIKGREKFNNNEGETKLNDSKVLKHSLVSPLLQSIKIKMTDSQQKKTIKLFDSDKNIGKAEPRQKILKIDEPISLKISHSFLILKNDGVTFHDVTEKKALFLTWQEVITLLKSLKFSFIFSQILPIQCFYDVGKILSRYVYKPRFEDPCCFMQDLPKELVKLSINKLYFAEGKYLKLFIMNQYNKEVMDLAVDCYFLEFEQLFQRMSKDEYIEQLNTKILQPQKLKQREQNFYQVEVWKQRKQTVGLELSHQIKTDYMFDNDVFKSSQFKILLILPRNIQLLLFVEEKDFTEENNQFLPISIHFLEKRQDYKLKVPIYKINRYFPEVKQSERPSWMRKYGKLIFESYQKCFHDFPESFNNMQFMKVTTYAWKSEMIPCGKYCAPLTIELIGSSTRIWGLCIRFFEQAKLKDKITFIYNPYYDLLAPLIGHPEDSKKFLLSQLVNGSLDETYKKLQKNGVENKIISIMAYWSLIDF